MNSHEHRKFRYARAAQAGIGVLLDKPELTIEQMAVVLGVSEDRARAVYRTRFTNDESRRRVGRAYLYQADAIWRLRGMKAGDSDPVLRRVAAAILAGVGGGE